MPYTDTFDSDRASVLSHIRNELLIAHQIPSSFNRDYFEGFAFGCRASKLITADELERFLYVASSISTAPA